MEAHKPIKRSKAFVQFSKEHHFGLLHVWQIRQDIAKEMDAGLISRYVLDFFEKDLRGHFKKEEVHLFSKLPVGDLLREQAEKEHNQLYNFIEAITQNPGDKQLLNQFANMLEKHIRFEERILFNHLQDTLSAGTLEQLLQEMEAEKGSDPVQNSCSPFKKTL